MLFIVTIFLYKINFYFHHLNIIFNNTSCVTYSISCNKGCDGVRVRPLGQEKNTFVYCCPTDPNFLVPTLNFFRDF